MHSTLIELFSCLQILKKKNTQIFVPLLILVFFLFLPKNSNSQSILINEFMASNATSITDEFGDQDDWVELYNDDTTAVDIGGMYLTDDLAEPTLWQIPTDASSITTIPAGGYLLLWFDKETDQGPLHVDAKLGSSGEDIGLFASDGTTLIDSRTFGAQFADVSEGRTPNAGSDWDYYPTPTPNAANDTEPGLIKADEPTASLKSGLYNNTQTISLATITPDGIIRYTTDGSVPTETSTEYIAPISISENTPLRAVTFSEGYEPSDPATFNYLFNLSHTFPVVTITASDEILFDPVTGMYPNYEEDIEIPAHVELIEPNGTVGFSQIAEIEIHGSASATIPQKSIALKAKKSLGGKEFPYPVFDDLDFEAYRSLIVRNSGQDNNLTLFRDAMVSSLVRDLSDVGNTITKPNLHTQGHRPSVVYINGAYWGMYNLRERSDKRYIKVHFDLDDDEIDLIDGFDEVKEGDINDWNDMMNFFQATDLSSDANFEVAKTRIDTDHYLDYVVFNVFNDNWDWPENNNRRWRERVPTGEAGGEWRFLTYDLDFTFGLFTPQGWNSGAWFNNSLSRMLDANSNSWPNGSWSTLPFRKMIENKKWRTAFVNRMADQLNILYNAERINERIDEFKTEYEPELQQQIDRWTTGFILWDNHIEVLRLFANNRVQTVRENFVSSFPDVFGTADVTLNASPANGGEVKFNTVTVGQDQFPWTGVYFTGMDIPVEAVAAPGYFFTGWSVDSMENNASSEINLSRNIAITANFEPIGDQQSQTITFNALSDKLTTEGPFQISASASSGLPVSFSIESGPATISGDTITLTGNPGTVTIKAVQGGNADYLPAPNVNRSFNVTNDPTETGPTVVLSTPSQNVDGAFTVNIDFNESVTDLTLAEVEVTNGTKSNPAGFGASYSFTVTPINFGTVSIVIPAGSAFNGSGEANQVSNTLNVTYENPNTAPTVILSTNSLDVNSSFTVDAQFSEAVTGLQLSDIQVSNGSTSNFSGTGANYSFTVTPTNSGTVTIDLPAESAFNNNGEPNQVSNTLEVNYSTSTDGCSSTENLALNQPATQSGTQQNGSASRAVDGNTNGIPYVENSVSITNWQQNAWWQVDLGSEKTIEEIRIWNRDDCCIDFLSNYHILISNNPFTSTDLDATIAQSGVTNIFRSDVAGRSTDIPVEATGRYVRVQLAGTSFLSMAEIEIIGCSSGGGPTLSAQNISFPNISDKLVNDADFTISATASSGLPVSFELVSGPASLSGNTIRLSGDEGVVTVRATQAGNSNYEAAPSVTRSFNVSEIPTNNTYCESFGNIQTSEWIQTVVLNSISNNSGNDDGYGDYTNQSTSLQAGSSYPILLTPGFTNTAYQETWRVWIDLNQDGDFEDDGELLLDGISNAPIAGNIEVPQSANNGATRMRVSMKWSSPTSSCSTFNYGEVEDYTVNISGGSNTLIALIPNAIFSPTENGLQAKAYPNPVSHYLVVDYTTSRDGILNIEITNLHGMVVCQKKWEVLAGDDRLIIDVAHLPGGTYTLFLKQGSQQKAIRVMKVRE